MNFSSKFSLNPAFLNYKAYNRICDFKKVCVILFGRDFIPITHHYSTHHDPKESFDPATFLDGVKSTLKLNAFVYVKSKHDLEREKKRSEEKKNAKLKNFLIAVKDNFCVEGMPTTCASRMLLNFYPPYTATVVKKLEEEGAIVVGKTNLDEFAMGNGTIDSIFGPTKNLWGQEAMPDGSDWYVPGGSSGGSAVAVAAGLCQGALSSDTGGSTRNPASYCGIVGLKPTYGTLSRHGLIPLVNSLDVPGIMAKRLIDVARIFNVAQGFDPFDSTSLRSDHTVDLNAILQSDLKSKVCQLKIGIPSEYDCQGLSSAVKQCWDQVAAAFSDAGAKVVPVSLPHTQYSIMCYAVLNPCEVASNMARYDGLRYGHRERSAQANESTEALFASSRRVGFNDVVKTRIVTGNNFLLKENYDKYYLKATKLRRLIAEDFHNVWKEGIDMLVTPVTLSEAIRYSDFIKLDNRSQSAKQDYCTQPANMAGIPAISLPIKFSESGLPLAVQLMGKKRSEGLLFQMGQYLENLYKFHENFVNS